MGSMRAAQPGVRIQCQIKLLFQIFPSLLLSEMTLAEVFISFLPGVTRSCFRNFPRSLSVDAAINSQHFRATLTAIINSCCCLNSKKKNWTFKMLIIHLHLDQTKNTSMESFQQRLKPSKKSFQKLRLAVKHCCSNFKSHTNRQKRESWSATGEQHISEWTVNLSLGCI